MRSFFSLMYWIMVVRAAPTSVGRVSYKDRFRGRNLILVGRAVTPIFHNGLTKDLTGSKIEFVGETLCYEMAQGYPRRVMF